MQTLLLKNWRSKFIIILIYTNKVPNSTSEYERVNHNHWGFNVKTVMNDEYADTTFVKLPSDADERLIERHITWAYEPVEIQ